MEFFIVGKIQNTHGLKGELKIKNLSDFDRFVHGNNLYIEYKNQYLKVNVLSKKETDLVYLVKFKGLEDINLVEQYKGCNVYIEKDDMGSLDEGEYYFYELIGKNIINQSGEKKAVVDSIREVPQGHMLVVIINGKTKLIPFRKEFIIDVKDNDIIINEIEGLL